MTRHWSLRTRFLTTAALCLLPLIIVSLFLLDSALDHSSDQLIDTDFAITDVVSQGLSGTLSENQLALSELAKDPRIQQSSVAVQQEALGQFRTARPSLSGVFLLAPDGSVVASSGGVDPTLLLPQFTDEATMALNGGESAISDKLVLPEGGIEVIALVQPVLPDPAVTTQIMPVGAVGSFLNVDRLEQTFVPATGYASGDTTIAVVSESQVIATSTGELSGGNVLTRDLLAEPLTVALSGNRTDATFTDGSGQERLAVLAPVGYPGVEWAVVVTTPSPMTYGPNEGVMRTALIALAVAAGITLLLALFFAERTARPLKQLASQASQVAAGDVDTQIHAVGGSEVAKLGESIRDMADRLTTQVRDTESAREEIAIQAERLRDLLRRTVKLQEDERRRIAGDIHDAVSPLITGALYQTRAMQLANGNGSGENGVAEDHESAESANESLVTVGELLERAMAELHDVIFALRPPDLDDLGVVAAIERYVAQINRTGLPSSLEVIGEPQRLSAEARLGIYRIVQEALHNALRHADADEAVVRMEWSEDRLKVTVLDNGSGFDPDQPSNPTSLGLLSMRERAAAIGATLEIISRPGGGTAVVLERSLANEIGTESGSDSNGTEPKLEFTPEPSDDEAEALTSAEAEVPNS